jgi:vacuolar-type H+-ATPase subunit F/Vma7
MAHNPEQITNTTRMIFMGESQLAHGFRLIGFETWADPSFDQVEKLVRELIVRRQNAFLVVDRRIAEAELPSIQRVRKEGGHIVVTPVPPLNQPNSFHLRIDDRLQAIFAATGQQSQTQG